MVTRDEIYQLGMNSPVIHNCITYYELGGCSWEEAMMMAVKALAGQRKQIFDFVTQTLEKSKAPLGAWQK